MSVVGATHALIQDKRGMIMTTEVIDLSDRARFKLDDLSMAPFCAHDCFHMHWRWTDAGPGPHQLGFVGYEPEARPGVPMVPEAQDVFLWFRAKGWFTYHAEHVDELGAEPKTWVPICHHGAAYLTQSDTAAIALAKVDVQRRSRVAFLKSSNPKDTIANEQSWSAFYWNIRYYLEKDASGQYRAVDRTTPTDAAGLLSARKL